MGRYLRGEAGRPVLPENYFDRATEESLRQATRANAPIEEFTRIVSAALPLQQWRNHSVRLFANWLSSAAAAKARRAASRAIPTRKRA
jgi:homoserine trans-succinylase